MAFRMGQAKKSILQVRARLALSLFSRLLRERPHVPTDVIFLHIFMNGKFLGTRFRPVVPT